MKIEDNFLDQEEFIKLQTFMLASDLDWHYFEEFTYENSDLKFMFFHMFYFVNIPHSNCVNLNPILDKINPIALWRIKANLLTRTSNIIEKRFHVDMMDLVNFPEKLKHWTTSIFYINTNNGYTEFEDGTKVESVANRMVTFSSNLKHRGTSCTDEKRRVVINFNYFKR